MSTDKKKMTFLEKEYISKVIPLLKERFSITNPHSIPKIEKIVVSMRFGKELGDKRAIESGIKELSLITGRKPAQSKARKSIAGFKLREGQVIGAYCTLRRDDLYRILENLIYVSLPRIRDFKGFSNSMFDRGMNFSFGISDHLIFQELSYDQVYRTRGLDVSIVIKNAKNKEMAICLLQSLNFPVRS
ncbi:MAG: 50S ribosomal protein L5 [Alphaproteobacteria bacterium]|nr:50S ribosomal protein L5 [Rickettsiales bacterium]